MDKMRGNVGGEWGKGGVLGERYGRYGKWREGEKV